MRMVYRIAPAKFAHDLFGEGARLYGGRWNRRGTAAIYTSETRSLAAMEFLVHVSLIDIPVGLKIISLRFPARTSEEHIDIPGLPVHWRMTPAPFELADLGTNWIMRGGSLLLRVPSVVMPQESNIIINPAHPDMKHVKIEGVEDFEYDSRLRLP